MSQNDPNLDIFKDKTCAVFKKLIHEECRISIKVSLLCCIIGQSVILQPKMLFKVSQGKIFFKHKNGQKWPLLSTLNVPSVSRQKFYSLNLPLKVIEIAPLGSGGEISMKNAI